jgi:hypothetical protein
MTTFILKHDDLYPEVQNMDTKLEVMRHLVTRKELDRMAVEEPSDWTIWSTLMEARNNQRRAIGLPLEGEQPPKRRVNKPLEPRQRHKRVFCYKE